MIFNKVNNTANTSVLTVNNTVDNTFFIINNRQKTARSAVFFLLRWVGGGGWVGRGGGGVWGGVEVY